MKKNLKKNPFDLLIDLAGRRAMETTCIFQGKKPSPADIKKTAKMLKKIINNDDNKRFVSYGIENNKVLWLWVSSVVKDDFDGKIILAKPFYMDSDLIENGCMERIVVQAKKFHKAKKLKVQILIPPSENKKIRLYEKEGFKFAFHYLSGKVKDSLRYVAKKKEKLPAGYEIKPIDLKKDFEKYLKVAIKSLKSDKTSDMYHMPVKTIRKSFSSFFQIKDLKIASFGLYYKNGLIGVFTVSIEKSLSKVGLVANIGILSAHRGKGFSSNLYYEGFNWLKTHKIERYMGVSSTERVVSRINNMKRKIVSTSMRIK